jgi:hypothetical protein
MKEVFLYLCEECGTCISNIVDRGNILYNSYCSGCRQGSFFKKIKIMIKTMDDGEERHVFAIEEKKDDTTTKGSDTKT